MKEISFIGSIPEKPFESISIGRFNEFSPEHGIFCCLSDSQETKGHCQTSLWPRLVQFFFCVQGSVRFVFDDSGYTLELPEGNYYSLYNPTDPAGFKIELTANTKLLCLYIDARLLHSYCSDSGEELSFLNLENSKRKYYRIHTIEPILFIPIIQIFSQDVSSNSLFLFRKAKILEIISLCFHRQENPDEQNCPFLKDSFNVEKIRTAKKIIMERMASPPTLKELSKEVGLNEYNLKSGFKNIYGQPVMTWLSIYKMEHARKMLEEGNYKINEISDSLGYNSPSHFIEAFRKRFGTTPKKYSLSGQGRNSFLSINNKF
jgi:AraC-like DNA-binding protein